ncbi:MAG: CHAT domain-containing protein [Cytophagales bacterium]|nr:MAG: CHAT domain-containing protein [Cytophagales bacterium]
MSKIRLFFYSCLLWICILFTNSVVKAQNNWDAISQEAIVVFNKGQYAKAIPLFEKALEMAEKEFGNKHSNYVTTLNNLGLNHYYLNQYDKAERYYLKANQIIAESLGKNTSSYVYNAINLALLYKKTGNYPKAWQLYQETEPIIIALYGKTSQNYATWENNLGNFFQAIGDLSNAEVYFRLSLGTMREVKNPSPTAYISTKNNLGALYIETRNYEKAIEEFLFCKENYLKFIDNTHPYYLSTCNNLAVAYESQKKYAEAELIYQEIIAIYEKTQKHSLDHFNTLNNLANLYTDQNKYKEARQLYQYSLENIIQVLGENHENVAIIYSNIGRLYLAERNYTQADLYLNKSLYLNANLFGKSHPSYQKALALAAFNQYAQGNLEITKTYLDTLIDKSRKLVENLFEQMSEKEKEIYYAEVQTYFEFYNNIAWQLKDTPYQITSAKNMYDNTLFSKGLLINNYNSIKSNIIATKDSVLINAFNDWTNAREDWLKAIQTNTNNSKIEEKVYLAEKKFYFLAGDNNITKKLTQKIPSWKDIQQQLKEDEAAIEMIRFRKYASDFTDTIFYAAMIVSAKTTEAPLLILLNNGNELENKYFNIYSNSIKNKTLDKISYQAYWEKINEALLTLQDENQAIKTIYFAPDGVFHKINLNAIYNPKTEKYIIDELDIHALNNTADAIDFRENNAKIDFKNKEIKAILMGFPDYKNYPNKDTVSINWENSQNTIFNTNELLNDTTNTDRFFVGGEVVSLIGTQTETNNIYNLLQKKKIQVEMFQTTNANEENLKNIASPFVLHIATHGFFMRNIQKNTSAIQALGFDTEILAQNPLLRSGLLLAGAEISLKNKNQSRDNLEDGIFTSYEAANLQLDKTYLVVLSACETGLGEVRNGEGVYGLQRAFQMAGARNILMSYWTVNDKATQELMTLFYSHWLKYGDAHTALRYAQITLRQQYKEPYYWAAFMMIEK